MNKIQKTLIDQYPESDVSEVDQSVVSQLKKSIVHGRKLLKISFLTCVYVIKKFKLINLKWILLHS